MALQIALNTRAGVTLRRRYAVQDGKGHTVDTSGWKVWGQLNRSTGSTKLLTLDSDSGRVTLEKGVLTICFPAADTLALPQGWHTFFLLYSDGSGDTLELLSGTLTVESGVNW